MEVLNTLTTAVNLFAISASLWLGFYIITRSPHSTLSRLGTLLLWTLDIYLLTSLLLANLPPSILISWIKQTSLLSIPFMLHMFVRMSPDFVKERVPTRLDCLNRIGVPIAYLIAIVLIPFGPLPGNPHVSLFTPIVELPVDSTSPGYVTRTPPFLYPIFLIFLFLIIALTLLNLWDGHTRTRRTAIAQTYDTFLAAVSLIGLGLLYAGLATGLKLKLSILPHDILTGASIILFGYAVARYSAMLEGRPMDRDFVYSMVLVGSLTAFYFAIVLVLYLAGQLSFLTLALTLIGAIAANSIFDGARLALDGLFYQRQFRTLRGNLRALSRELGTGGPLSERLQKILVALCRGFQIQKGFIALLKDNRWVVQATYAANPIGDTFDLPILTASESIGLTHLGKKGLPGMSLLIPIFIGVAQAGALVLGMKESGESYSEADLEMFEDLSDKVASILYVIQLQKDSVQAINATVQEFRAREQQVQLQLQQMLVPHRVEENRVRVMGVSEEELLPQIEDALRRLYDFSYLGEHPLAKLRTVELSLSLRTGTATSLERGKVLSEFLIQAVNHLQPDCPPPAKNQIPLREWHAFIILHDSYVLDEPNRNIMSRLYLSEGTFLRTRRRALRSVAKCIAELEQNALESRMK